MRPELAGTNTADLVSKQRTFCKKSAIEYAYGKAVREKTGCNATTLLSGVETPSDYSARWEINHEN